LPIAYCLLPIAERVALYGKAKTIGRFYRVFYFLSLTWQMNPKNSGLFKGLTAMNAK
jgi:hypothetical protein